MLEILLAIALPSLPNQTGDQSFNSVQVRQIQPSEPTVMSAEEHYEKGLSFHQADKLEEAIQEYQAAIAVNPQFDLPYINLSLILIGLDNLDDAETLLQKVLELPDHDEEPVSIHALANYNLAIIDNRLEKFDEARKKLETALAIAPNFEQAKQLLLQLNTTP